MLVALLPLLLAAPPLQDGDQADPGTETIRFPSADELTITAELHRTSTDPGTPLLVLFHQARSSRGEYRPIVPHLKEMGFNCLAVDLRSGQRMMDVKNGTARAASTLGKGTDYTDAIQDVVAALEYAREHYAPAGEAKLVAWGSSYSASLVLFVASQHPELVDGVISFSPGEYFSKLGKSATWVRDSASGVRCPAFLTGARSEEKEWRPILDAIASEAKTGFAPESAGRHGSRALWEDSEGSAEYWKALVGFLDAHFPRAAAPPGEH